MSGIGPATERRLEQLGIRTLGQLAEQDPQRMQELLGVMGPSLVTRAQGQERSEVRDRFAKEEVKSVSNERTFAHDLSSAEDVRAAVRHVSELVGTRLRKKGLAGGEVTLKLRFDYQHTRTAQRQLDAPTDDEHVFGGVALELLGEIWRPGTPVRLVGVAVSGFGGRRPRQLSLFDEEGDESKGRDLRELAVTLDRVRERFGNSAVSYGHDLRLIDEENTR
jgi:DNA polymerase-4